MTRGRRGFCTGAAPSLAIVAIALASYACGSDSFVEDCTAAGTCASDGATDAIADASQTIDSAPTDATPLDGSVDGASCPSSTAIMCAGHCVEPSDPAHCGSCSNVCPSNQPLCQLTKSDAGDSYACVTSCSGATPDLCGSTCTDKTSDPNHCGDCAKVCPMEANATASCTGGVCGLECNSMFHACTSGSPAGCFADNDTAHCGASCAKCTAPANASATCSNGACDYTCTAPNQKCGGGCFDTSSDPAHCGAGCGACPGPTSGPGQPSCSQGQCGLACGSGNHACNGACLSDGDPPSIDACVINETFGIFVSPAGSDAAGCGTRTSPCATITNALVVAKGKSLARVYACGTAGNYTENLVIDGSHDGFSVFGGLDCTTNATTWTYNATKVASVVSSKAGYALAISGLSAGVTFEDFGFTSKAGSAAGESSIAVFVSKSSKVVLRRSSITAGDGQSAPAVATGSNYSGAAAQDGQPPNAGSGGADGFAACTNGDGSTGGKGGDGVSGAGGNGSNGTWSPVGITTAGRDGAGGTGGQFSCATNADPGANGAGGGAGVGATSYGALDANGWHPSAGLMAGGYGKPGQGGGGGGGKTTPSIGGGGGGAGGCGGAPGSPANGGGSSIAVLSFQSGVTLDTCALKTGNGGSGGAGSAGQAGQGGGAFAGGTFCSGNYGGNGGGGGGGGGGAGGVSVGVLYSTTAPTLTSTTFTPGTPGAQGAGGAAGAAGSNALGAGNAGGQGTAGVAGVAQQTLSVP